MTHFTNLKSIKAMKENIKTYVDLSHLKICGKSLGKVTRKIKLGERKLTYL